MSNKKRTKQKRVYSREELRITEQARNNCYLLCSLVHGTHPEKNPLRKLKLYEKYVWDLVEYVLGLQNIHKYYRSLLMEEGPVNHNLPWSEDEDTCLVELRSEGQPLDEIARDLGRTSQACATRLSVLTGIPRDEIVSAFIEGTLDDIQVHGLFHGQVRKVSQ